MTTQPKCQTTKMTLYFFKNYMLARLNLFIALEILGVRVLAKIPRKDDTFRLSP